VYDAGGRISKGEDGRCSLWLPDALPEAKRSALEADFLTEAEAGAFWASL
jgi:hypothetical protein